jgi:hypothetical protein
VQQNGTNYYCCRWPSKLAQQPRIALQVVERWLVGAMAKVDNLVESKSYDWQQQLPHRVTLVATLSRACA